jgi:succinyl-CoA synthetase beta subunit
MDLLEYQAKQIFSNYSIPVPKGIVISNTNELAKLKLKFPLVLKAQVPRGGRGKAGGIKFIYNEKELEKEVSRMLGKKLLGYDVQKILIEEMLDVNKELYLSISIDKADKLLLLMASTSGGIDIEEIDEKAIFRRTLNPLFSMPEFVIRELNSKLNLASELRSRFGSIIKNLYSLFRNEDAELVEINPLIVTKAQDLIACDAKITIDNDALFRRKNYRELEIFYDPIERKASEKGISFVRLEGDIGVIANGAGLTMATLDVLSFFGLKPGMFLDLGGGADPERTKYALELILALKPKGLFINIFGGITRCDEIVLGLKKVIEKLKPEIPLVVRIKGTNENKGKEILKALGITTAESLEEGAEKLAEYIRNR